MVPPLVWRPNIVARSKRSSEIALFFNLWIAYMNRNTITMARIYGYIDYMATIRPLLALSPSFLIAANLCEIVNVALILRSVILISIEYFTLIFIYFIGQRKLNFHKILFIAKSRSSRLSLILSLSLILLKWFNNLNKGDVRSRDQELLLNLRKWLNIRYISKFSIF